MHSSLFRLYLLSSQGEGYYTDGIHTPYKYECSCDVVVVCTNIIVCKYNETSIQPLNSFGKESNSSVKINCIFLLRKLSYSDFSFELNHFYC